MQDIKEFIIDESSPSSMVSLSENNIEFLDPLAITVSWLALQIPFEVGLSVLGF